MAGRDKAWWRKAADAVSAGKKAVQRGAKKVVEEVNDRGAIDNRRTGEVKKISDMPGDLKKIENLIRGRNEKKKE